MTNRPEIDNAPGLSWRPLTRDRWMASWKCRADILHFSPRRSWLWSGVTPTEREVIYIQDSCQRLQNEMLIFARGGLQEMAAFDGTIKSLVACYQTDEDSPYRKLRYKSRVHYDTLCRRLERDIGSEQIKDIGARTCLRLYEQWSDNGRKATAGHHYMTMLRTVINFGSTFLDDGDCARLSAKLHQMKFKQGKPREERLTSEQVVAVRLTAHEQGKASIALAQAFQFECMLRQKDVIGEWVPMSEPGLSDTFHAGMKWLRGLRWEEIDDNLTLAHETSKREKMLKVPLSKAPMILEEFDRLFPHFKTQGRSALPRSGPIVINEYNQVPWGADEYRRHWRKAATAAGVPKTVRNMDSRAGAITEATEAGAELEHIKHAATHGDIAMTQRYSRGAADKIAGVMDMRTAHRVNKTGKSD